eukprot:1186341-Prorocentrum_minimum.AAC.2
MPFSDNHVFRRGIASHQSSGPEARKNLSAACVPRSLCFIQRPAEDGMSVYRCTPEGQPFRTIADSSLSFKQTLYSDGC